MIADFAELIVEVSERTGLEVASRAKLLVKLAEAQIERHLRVGDMETMATLTTDADGEVALPSDYLQMRHLFFTGCELHRKDPREILEDRLGYTIIGGTLKSSHASSAHVAYYYQSLPSLADNSTNWLLTKGADVYLDAVAAEAFKASRDVDSFMAMRQGMIDGIERLETTDRLKRYAGSKFAPSGGTP